MAREFNTPIREPWNGVIKTCLDTVDLHNEHLFKSNNPKHAQAAEMLRRYVIHLKNLIKSIEDSQQ